VAGGLQWLADATYIAAAARAAIIGFITAASHATTAGLRDEIARCQDLVGDLPFGVNVSMLPAPAPGERVEEVFEEVVRAKVRFVETSGRNPEPYLPMLRALQSVRNTVRAFRNETTALVDELERTHGGNFDLLRPHVAGALGRKAY
jgi:NAD(P)H-dependent flavin oxidoreductase YrpB (nitropropane dioxygenase family)